MPDSPFVGQIIVVPFNFAPRGYAFCQGQLLSIAQNTALFSLLGTQYGGDGRVTFALPNLQARVPLGFGQGPGLSNYSMGQEGGSDSVTLDTTQMPAHTHTVDVSGMTATARCASGAANQKSPAGNIPAVEAAGVTATYSDAAPDANMTSGGIAFAVNPGVTGGGLPHENRQPFLTLNFCIAMQGVFPPRT